MLNFGFFVLGCSAPSTRLTSAPHPRQNLASSAFSEPHFGQYILQIYDTPPERFPRRTADCRLLSHVSSLQSAVSLPGVLSDHLRVLRVNLDTETENDNST